MCVTGYARLPFCAALGSFELGSHHMGFFTLDLGTLTREIMHRLIPVMTAAAALVGLGVLAVFTI